MRSSVRARSQTTISNEKVLRSYLPLWAVAINVFIGVIIIGNKLSIQYFFYATPMIVRIDILSTTWSTLLWVGSLYFVYITQEATYKKRGFKLAQASLDAALASSLFPVFSIFLPVVKGSIGPATKQILDQISFLGHLFFFGATLLVLFSLISRNRDALRLFAIFLFSLLIPIEIWSLMHWIVYPFNIVSFLGFALQGSFIELQLFYLAYPTVSLLFAAFLFSWTWVPILEFVKRRAREKRWIYFKSQSYDSRRILEHSNKIPSEGLLPSTDGNSVKLSLNRYVLPAALLASLVLGVFIAYYPYINPTLGLVGTDAPGYYNSLTAMTGKDLYSAVELAIAINPGRVLYHLLLYLFQFVTKLPSNAVIQLMPVVTISANALATFWFVKIGMKKASVASLASILSFFSYNTTIAMHAGLLANWFAMALAFIMFGLLLKLHEKFSRKLLAVTILSWVAVFLIHYWSSIFFLFTIGCYVFLTMLHSGSRRIKLMAFTIFVAFAICLSFYLGNLTSSFFPSYGSEEDINLGQIPAEFSARLPVLINDWFYGSLGNPIMIILALIGIVACFQKQTDFNRLLISWVMVGSLLSLLVSPIGYSMDRWLIWRTLYLIPFQIAAALGLSLIVEKFARARKETESQSNEIEQRSVGSFSALIRDGSFVDALLLLVTYGTSVFLLILNVPLAIVLFLFNFVTLILIVHLRIRKKDASSTVIFLLLLFVALVLFNYTLRSLAPLATNRAQI